MERNREMNKKENFVNKNVQDDLLKMNLQYFADEGDDNDGDGGDDGDEGDPDDKGDNEFTPPASQSELDALINKSNQAAIKNATKDLLTPEQAQDLVRKEINKEKEYSDLSEDERKEREFEDERNQFQKEKEKFEYDRLIIDVKSDLVERELPATFAETLAVKGDKEKSLEAVVEFEKAFKQALAEERKKDYGQDIPGAGSGGTGSKSKSLGAKLGEKNKGRKKSIFNKGE